MRLDHYDSIGKQRRRTIAKLIIDNRKSSALRRMLSKLLQYVYEEQNEQRSYSEIHGFEEIVRVLDYNSGDFLTSSPS